MCTPPPAMHGSSWSAAADVSAPARRAGRPDRRVLAAADSRPPRPRLWPVLLLGIFFLSLYLLTMGGHLDSPDEELMFQVTRSLVERGSFDVGDTVSPESLNLAGIDGRSYVPYGPVSSVVSVPFYVLGRSVAVLLPQRYAEVVVRFAVGMRDPIISAGACMLVYLVAIDLGFGGTVAMLLTLAFGTATFVWPFSKYSFSEPVTGFFLLLAVLSALRTVPSGGSIWSALSAVALGLAIGSKVTTVVAVPAVLVYLAGAGDGSLGARFRRVLPFGLILLLPAGGLALLNMVRFGSPLDTGYHLDGLIDLSHPIGIAGLLLSPDKSLFLYAPVALLGVVGLVRLAARLPWETGLFCWLVASHVVVYGVLLIWHGAVGFGPRYLVPIVPFIVLPAGAMLASARGPAVMRGRSWYVFDVLFALGVVINLGGVLVDQRVSFDVLLAAANGNITDDGPRWNPSLSPVLIHWNELRDRYSNLIHSWSQPVSLVSGTYAREAVDPVDAAAAAPSDLFPRWTSGSTLIELKNHGRPTDLVLEYLDNRPSALGPAVVQILVDGAPLAEANITRTQSGVPLPDKRLPWFLVARLDDAVLGHDAVTVEVRSQIWRAPGDIRDLGVQIWDLYFQSGGQDLEIGETLFSPMPVSDARPWSYELETWFYVPRWHLADVWLWYLYLSGLPRWLMLSALAPTAGLLWSGMHLRRFLRRPSPP